MKVDATQPVTAIAAEIPGARDIFEKLGIDYSCAGARSLADAAYEEGIDLDLLIGSIRRVATAGKTQSWNERPLADLARYLVKEHHRLVRDELAGIAFGLSELCAPPATPNADVQSLRAMLVRVSDTLIRHMHDEEDSVFRTIEALEASWQANDGSIDGELRVRIGRIVGEHGTISAQLRTIRELRLKLEVSNELSPRCRRMLEALTRLEADVHESMFLENCILFPRAIAFQEQMTAA